MKFDLKYYAIPVLDNTLTRFRHCHVSFSQKTAERDHKSIQQRGSKVT